MKRTKQINSSSKFSTWQIRLLKRRKNAVLQQMFDIKRGPTTHASTVELRRLKGDLAHLQKMIKDSFRVSVNRYWQDVFSRITPHNAKTMLPTINRIFRPQPRCDLQPLVLPAASAAAVIDDLQLSAHQVSTAPATGDVTVHDTDAMLRVLGRSFAAVNVQNRGLGTPAFTQNIEAERRRFVGNTAEEPLTEFTADQPANSPTLDSRFTTALEVTSMCKATNPRPDPEYRHQAHATLPRP